MSETIEVRYSVEQVNRVNNGGSPRLDIRAKPIIAPDDPVKPGGGIGLFIDDPDLVEQWKDTDLGVSLVFVVAVDE